ncbi:hypothetical protein M1E25_20930 [Streptomyces sp. MTZ3.1]|uniref:Integral membrane protein n=1 Tax=Streptomyces meridianus TaxID=2938945 RepID=A0ABT0XBY5_9ACTN|nr:hypothetical protein [Streptomyces meridianus]MCM2579780.1 hypothetical protein [Streptomyces meridianus]
MTDDPGPALELLVHGVGGTTPQEMLKDCRTVRVTGDDIAGIHRRIDDTDAENRAGGRRDGPVREAYCWSNLTSGNGSRALWLILLPFMVVNLVHWMRPPVPDEHLSRAAARRAARAYGLLVRLIALSLTVLLVAAACEVALDLTAWQCAGSAACTRDTSWLGFLAPERGGWWSPPGRRLALAAVLPVVLTGLLWWPAHRTWSDYESQPPLRPDATRAPPDHDEDGLDEPGSGERPALSLPGFWYGRRLVARLRAAHTATGFLTVAVLLAAAAARHDRGAGAGTALDVTGRMLAAALAVSGAAVVWVVCRRGRSERAPDHRLDRAVVRLLPGAAFALLMLTAVHTAWERPGWVSSGPLPGNGVFGLIGVAQGTLVLALALVARRLQRRAPGGRVALRGLAGPAVAVLACALGGLLSGGVAQREADWLDGPSTPGMGDGGPALAPPTVLAWQAAMIPVLLLVLAAGALWLAHRSAQARRREMPAVLAEYPGARADAARTRRIAGAVARAGLTDSAPRFVGAVAVAAVLLGAAAVAGAWATGEVPGLASQDLPRPVNAAAQTAQALGSWLMGLCFLVLVAWGRRAYRDPSARRTIGILWDVGTFWPRAAHPFAPPCYAERAVPDLSWRMATWTGNTGGRLVISGHSQGSVLAAAAVWQLDGRARARIALLTYGSPLERLYGRWFPAFFGPASLLALHREVHSWRNLWRRTDPIGGPVRVPEADDAAGTGVDRPPLRDPLAFERTVRHPLPEPVRGHSGYQEDPAFAEERALLLGRFPGLPPQRDAADDGPPTGPVTDAGGQAGSGRSSG